MSVERMLVEIGNDRYVSLVYHLNKRTWQLDVVGEDRMQHTCASGNLKETVRAMYDLLKGATVAA